MPEGYDYSMNLKRQSCGYSIVELVVVIVVIGILATIVIVSYNGVQNRAIANSLRSDLNNASDFLRVDRALSSTGVFPTTLAAANGGMGVKASSGTAFTYTVNNTNTPKTFCLTATKNAQIYNINQEGISFAGPCPVLWLDAGTTTSYPGTGTIWNDLSGNGNNGTLVNGVTYNNTNSGALAFDGINGWASIPDSSSLDLVTGVTIEAWINPTSGGGTWYGILSKGNAQSYALTFNSPSTYLHFETPASNAINSPVGVVPFNVWTYVVATFDGLTKNIYVNGNLSVSGALVANLTVNNEPLRVGQGNDGEFFKGKIANVSVYSRALSAGEILQNFNALHNRYGI